MNTSTKSPSSYDVIVIGAGPNGLSAAIELARSQLSVLVMEAHSDPGGGARTEQLTLPGYFHDMCSTVHPLGVASPFFRTLGLERYGLSWMLRPLVMILFAIAIVGLLRPFLQDIRPSS